VARPRGTQLAAIVAWVTVGAIVGVSQVQPLVRAALAPATPACDRGVELDVRELPTGDPYAVREAHPNPIVVDGTLHPGSTAQTGLTFLAWGRTEEASAMLELLEAATVDVDGFTLLPYGFDFAGGGYTLAAPWYSAMDQGQALSLAVRLGDRQMAERLLPALLGPSPVARMTATGLWLEEYPDDPPDPVLNGAIFAAYGLYDEWAATRSEAVRAALVSALGAIRADLGHFRQPGRMPWYDLEHRSEIGPSYVAVYRSQMATLAAMTGDPCFAEMGAAFEYDWR